MSMTCRSTSCCDPVVNGLGGVVISTPENNSGGGGIDPHCDEPVAEIKVSKASVACGESFELEWTTSDVGTGGTASISPTVGAITADTPGSQTLTITATTTYTLTATNACGTTTATVTVTLAAPGMSISVYQGHTGCGDGATPYVEWSTAGLAVTTPATTVVISTDVALTGFPKTVAINSTGLEEFSAVPGSIVFTLTVTTPCATYTDTATYTYASAPTAVMIEAVMSGCNIVVSWEGDSKCDGQVYKIKGPGFGTAAGEWETVTAPSSRSIDPTDARWADQFVLGANNGYYGDWDAHLVDDAGTDWSDGCGLCVPPILTLFYADNDNLTCPDTGLATTFLTFTGYFLGSGVAIYDDLCNYLGNYDVTAVAGVPGKFSGTADIWLAETTKYRLYARTTCVAACNDLDVTVDVTACGCTEPVCTGSEDLPGCLSIPLPYLTTLSQADAFLMGDCFFEGAPAYNYWTGRLGLNAATCTYEIPEGGCPDATKFSAQQPNDAPTINQLDTLNIVPSEDSGTCYWTFSVSCSGNTVSYQKAGRDPVGTYSLISADIPGAENALPAEIRVKFDSCETCNLTTASEECTTPDPNLC